MSDPEYAATLERAAARVAQEEESPPPRRASSPSVTESDDPGDFKAETSDLFLSLSDSDIAALPDDVLRRYIDSTAGPAQEKALAELSRRSGASSPF